MPKVVVGSEVVDDSVCVAPWVVLGVVVVLGGNNSLVRGRRLQLAVRQVVVVGNEKAVVDVDVVVVVDAVVQTEAVVVVVHTQDAVPPIRVVHSTL